MRARIEWRLPFIGIALAALAILGVRVLYPRLGPPLIINYTASEPQGVYWIEQHPAAPLSRGQLVAFPVPENVRELVHARQWLRAGEPLLKAIGALSGDRVCIDDARVRINERTVGRVFERDSLGRSLPSLRGCFTVPAGYFLPLSTRIENSFDGRYFGAQPLSSIIGALHPVWTF